MPELNITNVLIQRPDGNFSEYGVDEDVVRLTVNYGPGALTIEEWWADNSLTAVSYPWREVVSVSLSAEPRAKLPPPRFGTLVMAP